MSTITNSHIATIRNNKQKQGNKKLSSVQERDFGVKDSLFHSPDKFEKKTLQKQSNLSFSGGQASKMLFCINLPEEDSKSGVTEIKKETKSKNDFIGGLISKILGQKPLNVRSIVITPLSADKAIVTYTLLTDDEVKREAELQREKESRLQLEAATTDKGYHRNTEAIKDSWGLSESEKASLLSTRFTGALKLTDDGCNADKDLAELFESLDKGSKSLEKHTSEQRKELMPSDGVTLGSLSMKRPDPSKLFESPKREVYEGAQSIDDDLANKTRDLGFKDSEVVDKTTPLKSFHQETRENDLLDYSRKMTPITESDTDKFLAALEKRVVAEEEQYQKSYHEDNAQVSSYALQNILPPDSLQDHTSNVQFSDSVDDTPPTKLDPNDFTNPFLDSNGLFRFDAKDDGENDFDTW